MISREKPRKTVIGVCAVGHETYWEQFEGLLDNLMKYHADLQSKFTDPEVEIVDFGMIDESKSAYAALERMQTTKLDLLFCNMVTYATSSTFAPLVKNLSVPIVLVALQPLPGLDYDKASTHMQLENDNICSVPEFMAVAQRMGREIRDVIIGRLYDDEEANRALEEWCDIGKVLHDIKGARIGLMGHVLEAMYDMHADPTAVSDGFNLHVPLLEVDDLVALYEQVSEEAITERSALIRDEFLLPDPKSDPLTERLTDEDLYKAAKASLALERFIQVYDLTGLAYFYNGREGTIQREVVSSLIVGNSLLNARGIPMCGEYDIKTCIAMLIMDRLDIGGSFAEFHPLDFREDFILVGHDGPHHIAIAEGKPVLRSLKKYHGKEGRGASVEFKLKEGPITMLGITQKKDGTFKFVIGEGYSKKGPIPPTGNTNTRGFFEPNTRDFVKAWVMEGPTHHFALGIGHRAGAIEKIGRILGAETVIVRP